MRTKLWKGKKTLAWTRNISHIHIYIYVCILIVCYHNNTVVRSNHCESVGDEVVVVVVVVMVALLIHSGAFASRTKEEIM